MNLMRKIQALPKIMFCIQSDDLPVSEFSKLEPQETISVGHLSLFVMSHLILSTFYNDVNVRDLLFRNQEFYRSYSW